MLSQKTNAPEFLVNDIEYSFLVCCCFFGRNILVSSCVMRFSLSNVPYFCHYNLDFILFFQRTFPLTTVINNSRFFFQTLLNWHLNTQTRPDSNYSKTFCVVAYEFPKEKTVQTHQIYIWINYFTSYVDVELRKIRWKLAHWGHNSLLLNFLLLFLYEQDYLADFWHINKIK